MGNALMWIGIVIFTLTLIVGLISWGFVTVAVEPAYVRAVSSHIDNAYELNTPDAMKVEISAAIQGMKDLGLEPDMYSRILPWDKTPKTRMDFQYTYLDNLNSRIDSVVAWKVSVYDEQKGIETLGDVYEQKMDNLREFINEGGGSDWIAHDAYYVNKQTFFVMLEYVLMILYIASFLMAGIGYILESDIF